MNNRYEDDDMKTNSDDINSWSLMKIQCTPISLQEWPSQTKTLWITGAYGYGKTALAQSLGYSKCSTWTITKNWEDVKTSNPHNTMLMIFTDWNTKFSYKNSLCNLLNPNIKLRNKWITAHPCDRIITCAYPPEYFVPEYLKDWVYEIKLECCVFLPKEKGCDGMMNETTYHPLD